MSRKLPQAIVLGPLKTATTWLYEYLHQRMDVGLPFGTKETFFFDRRYSKGVEWYASHFQSAQADKLIEVAPTYFNCEKAPERIKNTLGEPIMLVILRDPVERSISHFHHLRLYGRSTSGIRETASANPEMIISSKYASVLRRWDEFFDAQSIKIVFYETLRSDPELFVKQVCSALEIPFQPIPEKNYKAANTRLYCLDPRVARLAFRVSDFFRSHRLYGVVEFLKRIGFKSLIFRSKGEELKLSSEDERWLYQQFVDEIDELEERLNLDLSGYRREF